METGKKDRLMLYFAGAIRGGRQEQPLYGSILAMLKQYGAVLSEHVADEELSQFGETDISKEEIHKRELERMMRSDIVIAETTTPSLGVGYIVAKSTECEKKTICVYNRAYTDKLSAMIKGNPNIIVISYTSLSELEEKIKPHLK